MVLPQRRPMTISFIENEEVFLSHSKNFPMLVRLGGQSKGPIAVRVFAESTEESFPYNIRLQVVPCNDVSRVLLAQIVPYSATCRPASVKKLLENISEVFAECR